MKVKRYLVDDLPEAVQMIRTELGSDAVILNTKEIRTGGFLGLFRKKRVEVIAAVDEASRRTPSRPLPARPVREAPLPERKAAPPLQPPAENLEARVPMPGQAVRNLYVQGGRRGGGSTAASPAVGLVEANPAADTPSQAFAEALHQLQQAAAAAEEKPAAPDVPAVSVKPADPDETNALLQELRSMKEMMAKMARQQSFRSMPESVLAWSRRLAEQGVEPVHVERFAEEVRDRLGGQEAPDDGAAGEAAREVLRAWLLPCAGGGIGPGTRIVRFVGPTGVGKTTTIAKLAADQSFAHRRSVGFITADTYRISAVDQLRTYADILNVPLEVVFSPGELTRSYKKLEDRDLILMDTAGRNYRNELFVSEVNSLLAPGEKAETFLVLSLTHKYADMRAIVSQFAKYGVRRLLLTKADETDTYGSIVNLVREYSFPISYITCGQTVPDDIRAFDPEEWVRKLLGEPAHE
ncbi:flagellar biosynthesis protein FlhF [Cohnella sp. CFH 77786]|uniref:flagellar biosynthesis protein FlhF n=1 Tax=Cohnella sp. CFH 77786 TaxID=2662265 RepID=UPI001C60EA37|nr:flagellar biosynthesis protein FlhF [Cohnella sp. CFH 77786]MBW5444557.1 flagellar biosynthesis protein FlhF [Cohnella sp. CFH 77786]